MAAVILFLNGWLVKRTIDEFIAAGTNVYFLVAGAGALGALLVYMLVEPIIAGTGKIQVGDTVWLAQGGDAAPVPAAENIAASWRARFSSAMMARSTPLDSCI